MLRLPPAAALCAAWLAPLVAGADAPLPDWNAVAGVERVRVVTHDEDGDERDTTVWLAVVDGRGYIRTGSTHWGDNLVRDPRLVLRIEDDEYPLRVEFVEDEALRESVVAFFQEKYGFWDTLIDVVRLGEPKIMRLVPR